MEEHASRGPLHAAASPSLLWVEVEMQVQQGLVTCCVAHFLGGEIKANAGLCRLLPFSLLRLTWKCDKFFNFESSATGRSPSDMQNKTTGGLQVDVQKSTGNSISAGYR